jgi:hypothetical protein
MVKIAGSVEWIGSSKHFRFSTAPKITRLGNRHIQPGLIVWMDQFDSDAAQIPASRVLKLKLYDGPEIPSVLLKICDYFGRLPAMKISVKALGFFAYE